MKEELEDGSHQLKLAGVIIKKDARMSQRGRFVTLILSDPYGIFEVTIFNEDIFKNYANLINVKDSVVATCDVFKDRGGLRITAIRFASVEDELQGVQHNLKLHPKDKNDLQKLVDLLTPKKDTEKSNSTISVFLPIKNKFVAKINMPNYFNLDESDVSKLMKEIGE